MKEDLRVGDDGWLDFETGENFNGGGWVSVEAPLVRLLILVRSGSLLPLAKSWADNSPHDATEIELIAFCATGAGRRESTLFWDDGTDANGAATANDRAARDLRIMTTSGSFLCLSLKLGQGLAACSQSRSSRSMVSVLVLARSGLILPKKLRGVR